MPPEIIQYLIVVFGLWLVFVAIDYTISQEYTVADILIDGVMALCFPVTISVIVCLFILDSKKLVLKKKKRYDIE